MARKSEQDLVRACEVLTGTMHAQGLMAPDGVFVPSSRNGYRAVDVFNGGGMVADWIVGRTLGECVQAVWDVSRALELGRRTISGRV
jgi:hypothetical protein